MKKNYDETYDPNGKKVRKLVSGIVIAIFALIVIVNCFTIVPTGYSGVRITFGQISNEVVPNGINFKIPFIQNIRTVCNKQQDITFEGQIYSETSERTAIYYDGITVTYQISKDKSSWIYANVSNYEDSLVSKTLVASAIKSASKQFNSTDATNRSIIEAASLQAIQDSINEKYGEGVVYVIKVIISNADFEDTYNATIAQKQNSQLEYERQQIENKKAIEKAEADAKVKLTQAQADADALMIEAEAEAAANKLLQESLTDNVLQNAMIEKWDGELPKVTGGANNLLDITEYAGITSEEVPTEKVTVAEN